MNRARFLEERRGAWRRLDELVRAARGSSKKLRNTEVSELAELIREVSHDLSTVRSKDWGLAIELELNSLVRRAHEVFYRPPPSRPGAFLEFILAGFPRVLRRNGAYVWVALVLFLVPAIVSGGLAWRHPEVSSRIVPAEALESIEEMYGGDARGERSAGADAAMTGFYINNNIGIALRAFATGLLFGVGTIYTLIFNGLFFGVVTAHIVRLELSERFFSFVIGHASFELTAIVIAGAAGLILGHALLHPGPYSRLDAVRARGPDALRICGGAAVMLAIAALIEGFWSPSAAPPSWKFLAGGIAWLIVFLWLALGGRGAREE